MLAPGECFGMIRFGSRLDIYLPEGTAPLVAVEQTAIADKPSSPIFGANGEARSYWAG